MSESHPQLDALRRQMAAADVDLVAVGPTTNMRYLLGFAPHADERLCLLLVTPRDACMVVPALNAEQVAAHTDLPLFRWADETGAAPALSAALRRIGRIRYLAIDGPTRADFILPMREMAQPPKVTLAAD